MTTRRMFVSLLGGAAAAWPFAARAQQSKLPVVGFLNSGSPGVFGHFVSAFRQGLGEAGYVEHRNVGIEYRWAEGQVDRLPELVREFVRAQVAVICAGGPQSALAAKAATTTIPIVFTSGEDPIKLGLVESYNRPGANVTGVALLVDVLGAKRLGLLREIVPATTLIAVLLNPSWSTFETQLNDVQEAARAVGQQIHILQRKYRTGNRRRFRHGEEGSHQCNDGRSKHILYHPARPDRRTCGSRCTAGDLRPTRVRHCRRPDELCDQSCGCLSPGRRLQRQNFERLATG